MGNIYKITCLSNNKVYIGQTIRPLNERFSRHCTSKSEKMPISRAIRKYGREFFKIELIEECEDEILNDREIFWISYFKSCDPKIGYNSSSGGQVGTCRRGQDTRKDWICAQCFKLFKRYEKQVRNPENPFCSISCRSEAFKTSSKGLNNPNYKTGIHCNLSICLCGNEKDYRSKQCAICSKRGYVMKSVKDDREEKVLSFVPTSQSYLEIAKKTKFSRNAVRRIIKKYDMDISHFKKSEKRL